MSSSSESSEKGTRSSADLVGRSSPPPNPRTSMGEAASAANQHLTVQHDRSGFQAKRAGTSLPQDIVHLSLPPTELGTGHTIHGERSVTIGAQRGAKSAAADAQEVCNMERQRGGMPPVSQSMSSRSYVLHGSIAVQSVAAEATGTSNNWAVLPPTFQRISVWPQSQRETTSVFAEAYEVKDNPAYPDEY